MQRSGGWSIEPHTHEVEEHLGVERAHGVDRRAQRGRALRCAVPELLRAGEIEGAPRTGLRLVAELFERIGLQLPRFRVVGVGEHQMVDDFRDPAVLTARSKHARAFASIASAPPMNWTYLRAAGTGGSGCRCAG